MPIPGGGGTEPIPGGGGGGILWGGMLPVRGMLPPVGIIPGYPPLKPVMGGMLEGGIPKLGGGPWLKGGRMGGLPIPGGGGTLPIPLGAPPTGAGL